MHREGFIDRLPRTCLDPGMEFQSLTRAQALGFSSRSKRSVNILSWHKYAGRRWTKAHPYNVHGNGMH